MGLLYLVLRKNIQFRIVENSMGQQAHSNTKNLRCRVDFLNLIPNPSSICCITFKKSVMIILHD